MVMQSDAVWGKACFEQSDFGTHAVVSVVTNGVSDDANGCNIDGDTVGCRSAGWAIRSHSIIRWTGRVST